MQRLEKNQTKKILVLGGNGFIGRHVVQQLRDQGHAVTIGTRSSAAADDALTIVFHKIADQELMAKLSGFDVIINAVGILRERIGETYDVVHHRFVGRLAKVCALQQIRLVHVSAMGLNNPVRSRFLISKLQGEITLKRSHADWRIVRPSLIDGEDGYGAKWFRGLARLPIHMVPENARGRINPIHVRDLAQAIAVIALDKRPNYDNREYELGGDTEMDILTYLSVLKGRPPLLRCRVPAWLVRAASHVCDLLHLTPLSFGHYELLKSDNCPAHNRLSELLGRPSQPLGAGYLPRLSVDVPKEVCNV